MKNTLIDSGSLVAYLDRRDQWHSWALHVFKQTAPPFLTCDAVLSETCFLISGMPDGHQRLGSLVKRGIVVPAFDSRPEAPALFDLMARYASVPMSFADACLVRMSEVIPASTVFTTDSDFRIYRRHKRQVIPILAPPP